MSGGPIILLTDTTAALLYSYSASCVKLRWMNEKDVNGSLFAFLSCIGQLLHACVCESLRSISLRKKDCFCCFAHLHIDMCKVGLGDKLKNHNCHGGDDWIVMNGLLYYINFCSSYGERNRNYRWDCYTGMQLKRCTSSELVVQRSARWGRNCRKRWSCQWKRTSDNTGRLQSGYSQCVAERHWDLHVCRRHRLWTTSQDISHRHRCFMLFRLYIKTIWSPISSRQF